MLKFIIELIASVINFIFKPIIDAFSAWKQEVLNKIIGLALLVAATPKQHNNAPWEHNPATAARGELLTRPWDDSGTGAPGPSWVQVAVAIMEFAFFASSLVTLLLTFAAALEVFEVGIKVASAGLVVAFTSLFSQILTGLITSVIVGIVLVHAGNLISSDVFNMVPDSLEDFSFGSLTMGDFLLSLVFFKAKRADLIASGPFLNTAQALAFSVISLFLMGLGLLIGPLLSATSSVSAKGVVASLGKAVLDLVAFFGALWGRDRLAKDASVSEAIKMTYTVVTIIDTTALAVSGGSVVIDLVDMLSALKERRI